MKSFSFSNRPLSLDFFSKFSEHIMIVSSIFLFFIWSKILIILSVALLIIINFSFSNRDLFKILSINWFWVSIISFSSLNGWELITLISPIFTYLLLVYVSGIRILEYNGNKKWGHLDSYKEYKDKTPRLLGLL